MKKLVFGISRIVRMESREVDFIAPEISTPWIFAPNPVKSGNRSNHLIDNAAKIQYINF